MTFAEWSLRLVSNLGFIARHGHSHGRLAILGAYVKIEFKRFFLANLLKRKMVCENVFGYKIHFFEYETFAILFEELYLPDAYHFSASSKEPLILDCGSNIGLTILYFKKIYPQCKIIGFEADVRTFKLLEKNIKVNNLENVTLINRALYDTKGTVPFYVSVAEPGLVQSIRPESLAHSEETRVETELLSEHINERVDMLKMDIEGAEQQVMNNLVKERKLPFIQEMILEYHHHMTPVEDRLGKFLEILEDANFGYQLRAPLAPPFRRGEFQGFLVYAYHK